MGIRTSEQTGKLMQALAKAQGQFGAAIKSSQNPAFRSKYADLTAIIDATLEHLNKEGIVVMQHPALEYVGEGESREAFVRVTTRLQFEGEWMESDMSIPAVQRDRFDAQSVGSAITYGCRYALQSILVVPREDDDANAASGRGSAEAAQDVAKKKIADLQSKKANTFVASLFYTPMDNGLYDISGDDNLKRACWKTLKPFWQEHAKAFIVNDEQLEGLKFQFEESKVPFSLLKAAKSA